MINAIIFSTVLVLSFVLIFISLSLSFVLTLILIGIPCSIHSVIKGISQEEYCDIYDDRLKFIMMPVFNLFFYSTMIFSMMILMYSSQWLQNNLIIIGV